MNGHHSPLIPSNLISGSHPKFPVPLFLTIKWSLTDFNPTPRTLCDGFSPLHLYCPGPALCNLNLAAICLSLSLSHSPLLFLSHFCFSAQSLLFLTPSQLPQSSLHTKAKSNLIAPFLKSPRCCPFPPPQHTRGTVFRIKFTFFILDLRPFLIRFL